MNYRHDSAIEARTSNTQSLNIVVLGYIVRGPLGGLAWHHLQYVLGLARMGHTVTFVEDSDDYDSCFDPDSCEVGCNPAYGLEFARQSFSEIGLYDCWAYHDAHSNSWFGPRANDVLKICNSADMLLNLSGVNPLRPWFDNIEIRVFIDTDPVFTQIKHLQDKEAMNLASLHTHYFSFGENIADSSCTIPDDGYHWMPTRQPVVIDCWSNDINPVSKPDDAFRFTSIMQWDSYPEREYRGVSYGMKSRSFQPFMTLPQQTDHTLEMALGSATAPRDELQTLGWSLKDSLSITRTVSSYRKYLQHSHAEFGISKHGYVEAQSGWFSERSANYLASGRPVIVQDTGFSKWLDTDFGVVVFSTPDEAATAIQGVQSDYARHSRAAMEIAEDYFRHEKVLNDLLNQIFSTQEKPEMAVAQ